MKVLLIENQKTQFDSIKKLLTDNDIEVLPDEQDYKNLISNIKVILQGWKFYSGAFAEIASTRSATFLIRRKKWCAKRHNHY